MPVIYRNAPPEEIREFITYDPISGAFSWLKRCGRGVPGKAVATVNGDGYLKVGFRGREYKLHRLAWFLANGEWPNSDIDHVNCDRSDNRLSNLRLATRGQNCANSKVKSGRLLPKGVRPHKKRFVASITFNRKRIRLGSFKTKEEAAAAYFTKARELFGDFARAG